ncbi:MAG: hypothetical protein ACI835_004712, partial [Planctomycetota bacterium]
MKITSIILLLGATAGLVYLKKDLFIPAGDVVQATSGNLLFPELGTKINDVLSVEIASGTEAFTLSRGDESWGMADKAGYPADGKKLLQLLVALSDAKIVEEKTSNTALYSRLGVEDPAEGIDSKRVTVQGAEGPLASLIVGNARDSKGGATVNAFYVRRAGEEKSWLVEAKLEVAEKDSDWLNRDVLDLAADQVQAVEIRHADASVVYALKQDDTATDMELQDLPEGKELRYASIANSLASGLQRLQMDDVLAADSITFDNPPQAVATFWTFDGLKYTVTTQLEDDKLYARVAVVYDGTLAPGVTPVVDIPMPETDPAEDGANVVADGEPKKTPEMLQAEAGELNAKLGSWVYAFPSWKKSTFQKTLDDMLKDIELPEAEAIEEGGVDLPNLLGPPTLLENPGDGETPIDEPLMEETPEGVEGDSVEGEQTEGEATEGESGEAEQTEGEATEGESGEAEQTEGEATEGESGEGEQTEGEATEGESGEGEQTEGEATEGESGEGEQTEGEATE